MVDFNVLHWITGAPVAFGIVMAVSIALSIWAIRVAAYRRAPTRNRIADYFMEMPHLRQRWKVTLYGLDFRVDTKFLNAVKEISRDANLQTLMEKNKDMFVYIGRHVASEATTKDSGLSLIVSTAPLDHSDYFIELEEHMNWIKGYESRLRVVSHSTQEGIYFANTKKAYKGEKLSFIFYDPKPIAKHATIEPKKFETVEVYMNAIASGDIWIEAAEKTKYNTTRAEESEKHAQHMEELVSAQTGELNEIMAGKVTKRYDNTLQQVVNAALNPYIAGGIVLILTAMMPQMLERTLPGYTVQMYVFLSGLIGLGSIAFLSWMRK